jgi:hypothetical protein
MPWLYFQQLNFPKIRPLGFATVLTVVTTVAITHSAVAQAPYLRAEPQKYVLQDFPSYRRTCVPFEKWIGERFIFPPKVSSVYTHRLNERRHEFIKSEELAGRVGIITSLPDKKSSLGEVLLKMEDNGEVLAVGSTISTIELVYLEDIDDARKRIVGKSFWFVPPYIVGIPEIGKETEYNRYPGKQYRLIKIIDVIVSNQGFFTHLKSGIEAVIQDEEGRQIYVPIDWSPTNLLQSENCTQEPTTGSKFDLIFLSKDPRIGSKWPKAVWKAIENYQVLVGMTPEQAIMSWGQPIRVITNVSKSSRLQQWVYGEGGKYLYFQDGKLVSFEK